MHISILLMEQIIQLFLMIFMGFLIVKAKLLNSEDSKILSIIVLYLIIPCVIINAFQVDLHTADSKRPSYCPCWFCYDTGNSFDCCFYFGKSISFE